MTATMTTSNNPYFDILERCADELKPFADGKNVPVWVAQLIEIQGIIDDAARALEVKQDKSVLKKVAHKGKKLAHEVVKETKNIKDKDWEEKHMQAATTFNNYIKDLEELLPVSTQEVRHTRLPRNFIHIV